MKIKKILCAVLICALCLGMHIPVYAAGTYTEPGSNLRSHNWANPVKCHTISKANGNVDIIYSVWDGSEQHLIIEEVSSSGVRLSRKNLSVPGRTWGGTVFQAPDDCYYIATGNDGDTAFFISKYSMNWDLIGTASIGQEESYTATAFDGGNCDMTMIGEYLIVHAARGRLDGHQSNITFYINTKTMTPTYITGFQGFDHVSHSFSQFIRSDGNQMYMVDQGDGYPRGVCLQSYETEQTADGLTQDGKKQISLMKIWGETGANYTGVTVDGFELGSKNNIVVGTSVPHDTFASNEDFAGYKGGNNIYIALVDKAIETSNLKWLTSYSGDTNIRNLESAMTASHCYME